jgi:uncharacterized Zn-binding protein involved in type VI secretion
MGLLDSLSVEVDAVVDTAKAPIESVVKGITGESGSSKGSKPEPPPNPARRVEQVAGGILAAVNMPVELLNTGFAMATNFIAQALPSFPAATMTSLYVGPPHGHAHPPSLIPPNPVPVPLPSLGPVVLGTSVQVMINGFPAARSGDIGSAPTCCGFYPMYEIFLGSSKVFIGGTRAARMGDMCKACMPGMAGALRGAAAAMAAAAQAVGLAGIVANAVEAGQASDPNMSAAMGMAASMGAAQMAADTAAMAVMAAMGSDPAVPPGPGALVMGQPNVLIGGFPMPNLADVAAKAFGKLAQKVKAKRQSRKKSKKGEAGCPTCGKR